MMYPFQSSLSIHDRQGNEKLLVVTVRDRLVGDFDEEN